MKNKYFLFLLLSFFLFLPIGNVHGESIAVNKDAPLVSVVIPVYNVEEYLEEGMESVVNQTYKNLQIICVDDGSTDNSRFILEKYVRRDPRVTLVTQKNQGVSAARNAGIELARGEYIAFIDPDDYLDLRAYEIVVNQNLLCQDADKADIIVWGYNVFPYLQTWYGKAGKTQNKLYTQDSMNAYFNENSSTVVWNKFYKTDLIKKNDITFKEGLKYGEDIYFNMMVYPCAHNIRYMSNQLYNYRTRRKGSATNTYGRKIRLNNQMSMFESLILDWEKLGILKGNEGGLIGHFVCIVYNEIKVLKGDDAFNYAKKFMNLLQKHIEKSEFEKCSGKVKKKLDFITGLLIS